MSKPNTLLKRAGRVIAGINILFNLATTPKPPDLQPPAPEQALQSQWAKNEKANVLPNRRNRARELGYQLREPESAEHRPREEPTHEQTAGTRAKDEKDSHDQALSQQPSRGTARRAVQARNEQAHERTPAGPQTGQSRGREGQGR